MSLSTYLESKNKDLLNSLYEWQEKVRQNQVIIGAKDERIADLEGKVERLEDLQDAWEYVHISEEIPVSYSTLLTRVRDLETQNRILIETGHWIGQDEAYDLKVAAEELFESLRWKSEWTVTHEAKNKLRDALFNCKSHKPDLGRYN